MGGQANPTPTVPCKWCRTTFGQFLTFARTRHIFPVIFRWKRGYN